MSLTVPSDFTCFNSVMHSIPNLSQNVDGLKFIQPNVVDERILIASTRALKTEESSSTCTKGVLAGTAVSLVMKNPIPFFLSLFECFTKAHAQQPLTGEFPISNDTQSQDPSVATLSNDNFVATWSEVGGGG